MAIESIILFLKQPEIAAVLLTVAFAVIARLLQPKARIVWGVGHQFCHNVALNNGTSLLVYSKNIAIKNNGKDTAREIEVHFGHKPEHFQIWPLCNYSVHAFPDNHFMIKIDQLEASEYINIELLQGAVAPPAVYKLLSSNGSSKTVHIAPQQIYPLWVNISLFSLILLGLYKIFEWTATAAL